MSDNDTDQERAFRERYAKVANEEKEVGEEEEA